MGNSLKILFFKVAVKDKKLNASQREAYEDEADEIEASYIRAIVGISNNERYKEVKEKADHASSDREREFFENKAMDVYNRLLKKQDEKRANALRELEKKYYGEDCDRQELWDFSGIRDYDIKFIDFFEYKTMDEILDRKLKVLSRVKVDQVIYKRFLQLEVTRLKDSETFKEKLKIDIKYIDIKKNGEVKYKDNGSIISRVSDLDSNLLKLIDYGTELRRQDILDVKRTIMSNYADIEPEFGDLADELKLSYICQYIHDEKIEPTVVNKRRHYLIPSKDFDKEFAAYKNMNELCSSLVQEGIIFVSKGRKQYKYSNGDYFIAINVEHPDVVKLMMKISGNNENAQEQQDEK